MLDSRCSSLLTSWSAGYQVDMHGISIIMCCWSPRPHQTDAMQTDSLLEEAHAELACICRVFHGMWESILENLTPPPANARGENCLFRCQSSHQNPEHSVLFTLVNSVVCLCWYEHDDPPEVSKSCLSATAISPGMHN